MDDLVAQPTPLNNQKQTKLVIVVISILAVATVAVVAVWLLFFKPSAAVKKDIPLVRWELQEKGLNSFYPTIANENAQLDLNRQIFEGLVRFDGIKIVPLLATSWVNPDTSTWIFTLRQGVKFHTGRVMTAQDVKDSLLAANGTEIGDTFASTIKSVEVTTDGKVKITTDGPDPVLLSELPSLFIFDGKSGKSNDAVNGTGPYQLKPGDKPTETAVKLVAYDAYHGGHVYTREVDIKTVEDRDAIAADYNNKKVDVASVVTLGGQGKVTRPHGSLYEPNPGVTMLGLNTKRSDSPLANVKTRRALYLATDPTAILKVRQQDGSPAAQIVTPDIPGYNAAITRPARDVSKAKQLLTDAGYKNGVSLTFTYSSAAQSTAEEIAREAAEAGIKLNLDPQTDVNELIHKALGGGTDVYYVNYTTDTLDGLELYTSFYQGANYENAQIDDLINQSNVTLDPAKRLGLLQQIAQIAADDVAIVPLFDSGPVISVYDPTYHIKNSVFGAELGVYFWQVYGD